MRISGERLTKEYIRRSEKTNVFSAVREADIELNAGTLTVICGRSGSGKSTLLNMLAGILTPTSGSVVFDPGDETNEKCDIYAMDDQARSSFRNMNIGYIPQGSSAMTSLTVRENILLPARIRGNEPAYVDRAEKLMESLGILHISESAPRELSGGELRRMAVARALIMSPGVIFADEPTGDLDDENTRIVFDILRASADDGAVVLLVTHEEISDGYADVMLKMSDGRLDRI